MPNINTTLFDRAVELLTAIPHLSYEGTFGYSHFLYGYDGECYPINFDELPRFVDALEATARDCGL